jgi:hypothetical protein
MSIPARVMGIADIFEALTAKDRPYKRGKTLTESLEILGRFKQNGHVDPDLFDVFVREKVYLRYAEATSTRTRSTRSITRRFRASCLKRAAALPIGIIGAVGVHVRDAPIKCRPAATPVS